MKPSRLSFLIGMTIGALIALRPAHAQPASAAEGALQPGESFKECRNCPEMRNYLGFRVAKTLD